MIVRYFDYNPSNFSACFIKTVRFLAQLLLINMTCSGYFFEIFINTFKFYIAVSGLQASYDSSLFVSFAYTFPDELPF